MPKKIAEQVEEMGIAFIYAVILIGSVGFAFWSTVNTSPQPILNATGDVVSYTVGLDTTQVLAWGLVLTFLVLGVAFGFMSYMRQGKKGRR
jgi:hypothetical protein